MVVQFEIHFKGETMTTISIVYHSGMGHTKKMAEAVARGAGEVDGVKANLISIEGQDITNGRWQNEDTLQQLDASDGIIFGSPTYMGGVSGQMECFFDATAERWMKQAWRDKVASGFSVSGGPSGDKFNTLMRFATLAMQHGMIWVGLGMIPSAEGLNRLSFFFGAAAQAMQEPPEEAPNAPDLKTGEALGRRVAEVTRKLSAAG
jgi:NAD(P)H dehydrogenase (quinone)